MSDFRLVKLLDAISITLNGPSFTGEYNNTTTYQIGQSVSYLGSSYVAYVVTTGNLPTNDNYWQLLASIGETGAGSVAFDCRNSTGTSMPSFSVVYISGSTGANPNIELALGVNDPLSSKTFGITSQVINNNNNGRVVHSGEIDNLDTSAFSAGDLLWLSPTIAGAAQNTRPATPYHAVFLGYVVRSSANVGKIIVTIQNGFELEELHDVLLTTPVNEDVIEYEAASGLWKNKNKNTFELVSKNIKSWDYSFNYTLGSLTSIVYTDGVSTITKTLNYTTGTLTSLVLSGDTPSGISLTKTLSYTSGVLTGVAYS
jgi:hypothetical protein